MMWKFSFNNIVALSYNIIAEYEIVILTNMIQNIGWL